MRKTALREPSALPPFDEEPSAEETSVACNTTGVSLSSLAEMVITPSLESEVVDDAPTLAALLAALLD